MDGRPERVTDAPGAVSTGVVSGAVGTGAVATPAVDSTGSTPTVARQRWRLVLARSASADARSGRELTEAWESAIEASGLPLHRAPGRPKARIHFGAPVPAVMALDHELADVVLTELVPRWRARELLEAVVPVGWRLIDLYDVWPGEPPLPGQIAAADYRIDVDGVDAAELRTAASRLLAVRSLPRVRFKGSETVRYDLRPLLADVTVLADGPPSVIRVRTRFDPTLGTGRPEEVVAALGDASRSALEIKNVVRERILTAADLDERLG